MIKPPDHLDGCEAAATRSIERSQRIAVLADRLSDHLEHSDGIPIRKLSEQDSMVNALEEAKETNLLQTNRSRRAVTGGRRI